MGSQAKQNNQRRVALVIGSGGVKCAAALGLLKVLQREGIDIAVTVGCSGGSLYAAAIALGYTVSDIEAYTMNLWTPNLMKDYTSNLRAVQSGEMKFTERSGLVDDGPLAETLKTIFGDRAFADARIPLHIVATDFLNGEKVVISEGSTFDAVRASLAIPTIFPPWEVGGRLLVDGAASDPLPVDVAIKEGGQVILAMGFELDYRPGMRSLTAVNTQLTSIYTNNLLRSSFAFHNLAHHDEIIPLVPNLDRRIGSFDTHLIPYIIEQGEHLAEQVLPYLRSVLATAASS